MLSDQNIDILTVMLIYLVRALRFVCRQSFLKRKRRMYFETVRHNSTHYQNENASNVLTCVIRKRNGNLAFTVH